MVFKKDKCPTCGRMNTIIPSNNKLVPDTCNYCVTSKLNYNNIEDADFFCRTLNYPFYPDKWMKISKMYKKDTFMEYISWVKSENPEDYESENQEIWKRINDEWDLSLTHDELISKLQPIKEDYLRRNRIKWGSEYSFEELINLENLFVNTLKANDISNPMQSDAIKKACKLSVALDRAIVSGSPKEINDLSSSYQKFIKTAQIDQIITESSRDVISNVSELVAYLEENNFEFKYYDGATRDVVDKSIKDIQQYLRRLVLDNTGLEAVFEQINDSYKKELEIKESSESFEKVPLEDLYQAGMDSQNSEIDEELEEEDINEDIFSDDEDDYFG